MTTTASPTVDNGVNVEALRGARQALTDAPEAARSTWRARCDWARGTHSRATIDGFADLGQEHHHRQPYTIDADASEADLEAIIAQSQKRSAVVDVVTNPTAVHVRLA